MRVMDLRDMPAGNVLTSDLCIVGSGPAAFAIAAKFAGSRHEVLVLESGSHDRESSFSDAQNEIESIGAPREMNQQKVRHRILGGASHTWSGRCTTLDEIDYETRPWLDASGWPIKSADIAPFLDRAAEYLGAVPTDYSNALFEELQLPRRFDGQNGSDLRSVFWQFSRASATDTDHVRIGPRFTDLKADNVRVVTHATATNIATNEQGDHVQSVEVATPDGVRHHVRSRLFILCAGGIENPRLMLASNRLDPRGIGNRKGLVGRFFMDHPRTVVGTFDPAAAPAIQKEFFLLRHGSGARMQRGLSLSFEVQRREHLLNCAAWITQHWAENDVWNALRTIRHDKNRGRLAEGGVLIRNADQVASGLWNRFVRHRPMPRRFKQIDLDVIVEQTPDPNSRISLSSRKDALGVPISKIDWRIGDMERHTVIRLGYAINEALASAGLPTVSLVDWIRERRPENATFRDVAHPIGATRMGASEESGVVDPDGKVFGIQNLYVAGSSVFPTSGHANPTLMIVALALRLADRLQQQSSTTAAA